MLSKAILRKELDRHAPFEIVMADGGVHEVAHPDFLIIPPGKASQVFLYDGKGKRLVLSTLTMTGLVTAELEDDFHD